MLSYNMTATWILFDEKESFWMHCSQTGIELTLKLEQNEWTINFAMTKVNQKKNHVEKMELKHKASMNWCFDELSECYSEETFRISRYSME